MKFLRRKIIFFIYPIFNIRSRSTQFTKFHISNIFHCHFFLFYCLFFVCSFHFIWHLFSIHSSYFVCSFSSPLRIRLNQHPNARYKKSEEIMISVEMWGYCCVSFRQHLLKNCEKRMHFRDVFVIVFRIWPESIVWTMVDRQIQSRAISAIQCKNTISNVV